MRALMLQPMLPRLRLLKVWKKKKACQVCSEAWLLVSAVLPAWLQVAVQSVWLPWLRAVPIRLTPGPMLVQVAVRQPVLRLMQSWDHLLMQQVVAVAAVVLVHLHPVPRL
jgi:hypothetical protein